MAKSIISSKPARGRSPFGASQEERNNHVQKVAAKIRAQKRTEPTPTTTELALADSPQASPPLNATTGSGATTATTSSSPDLNAKTPAGAFGMFEVDVAVDDGGADQQGGPLRIGLPDAHAFVRTKPVANLRCITIKSSDGAFSKKTYYLVTDEVAREVPADAGVFALHLWAARDGSYGVLLVGKGVRNPYTKALSAFVAAAQTKWFRFRKDAGTDEYGAVEANEDLGPVEFPDLTKDQVIARAFGQRFVTSADDPIIRGLKGLL